MFPSFPTAHADSLDTPFRAVLAPHIAVLPPALRDHYLVSATTPYRIVLEGRMDRIWHRPAWLWPLFWFLTLADMLFPETGVDVPAIMTVTGGRDRQGRPYQTWNRSFQFPRSRCFNAMMIFDDQVACPVERLGPGQLLQMAWDVQFHAPATIEIRTTGCGLRIGQQYMRLPRFCYPTVRAIEIALPARDDAIHIDLSIEHPLLGRIFGYEGTFFLRREVR